MTSRSRIESEEARAQGYMHLCLELIHLHYDAPCVDFAGEAFEVAKYLQLDKNPMAEPLSSYITKQMLKELGSQKSDPASNQILKLFEDIADETI